AIGASRHWRTVSLDGSDNLCSPLPVRPPQESSHPSRNLHAAGFRMRKGGCPMKISLTKRTIGFVAAGAALIVAVGASLMVIAGGCRPNEAMLGYSDHNATQHSQEPLGSTEAVRVKTIRPVREHLKRTTTQTAHVEPYERADLLA